MQISLDPVQYGVLAILYTKAERSWRGTTSKTLKHPSLPPTAKGQRLERRRSWHSVPLAAACYPLLPPLSDEAVSPLSACGGFAQLPLLVRRQLPAPTTQTPIRLLCLLLWLGRVYFASAAQKAVRLEIGFDSGLSSTDFLGRLNYEDQPSYFVTIGLGTPPQPINATLQPRSVALNAVNATALVCRDARGANNCAGLAYDKTASTSVIALASQGVYSSYVGDTVSFDGNAPLTDRVFDIISPVNAFQPCTLGLKPGIQYHSLVSEVM